MHAVVTYQKGMGDVGSCAIPVHVVIHPLKALQHLESLVSVQDCHGSTEQVCL